MTNTTSKASEGVAARLAARKARLAAEAAKPIEVGDRIRIPGCLTNIGHVLVVGGEFLQVYWPCGGFASVRASEVVRVGGKPVADHCCHDWDGPPQVDTAITCIKCGLRQA